MTVAAGFMGTSWGSKSLTVDKVTRFSDATLQKVGANKMPVLPVCARFPGYESRETNAVA